MKLIRKVGAASQIFQIFIADSSSTTGAGLTALTSGSSGLTAYYHRDTDTTATVISLTTMTLGTFTSSGFLKIDDTNMPGWYQFCPPNAALASGASSVAFHLKGATNMAPLPIEVDLDAQVDVTFWNGTVVASPATAGIPDVNAKNWNNIATVALPLIPTTAGRTLDVSATGEAGVDWANVGSPTTTVGLTGTTISTSQVVASVTGAVGSVTGAVGSVTGAVGSVTGNVGGNVTGSVGSVVGNVGGNVTGSVGSVVADVGITQGAADKVFGASGAAMAELGVAAPSATPSPRNAMMLVYMTLRNKLTTTATVKSIFNDAGTAITTKGLSDDGVTYTETEMS